MTTLDLNTTVGQWVAVHPQTSRVFETFKIDYCCGGGKPLAQACSERCLDPQNVLAQLAAATTSTDQQPEQNWTSATLTQLCDHIEQAHHAYLQRELPRLTDLIAKVVSAHGDRYPELNDVQKVFIEFRGELESHMMKEERVLFPAIRQLESSSTPNRFPFGSVANPVACMEHEHDHAGAALMRLRELTDDYQPPADACATYRVMLTSLAHLETDMHQHVHKENNILFPRAIKLETDRANA